MDKNDLIQVLTECFEELKTRDKFLFEINAKEETLNHRFGVYLMKKLESGNIHVDLEYNRHIHWVKYYHDEGNYAAVDIVVHQRGTDENNLVAIECKKRELEMLDVKKIQALISSEFKYQYGVTIQYFLGLAILYFFNPEGDIEEEKIQL